MSEVHIREASVSMSMVDGEVLTSAQMSRIVAAVLAALERGEADRRSRQRDTHLAGSRPPCSDREEAP